MGKEGNKKTISVGDNKYTLQNPGVRWYIKHQDKCRDRYGSTSKKRYIAGLLDNVVINPLKVDDFDVKTEKEKKVTVNGEEYTVKYVGNKAILEIEGNSKDDAGQFSQEVYIDNLMAEFLEEDVTIDDFEKLNNVQDLIEEIENYNRSKELKEVVKSIETFLGA
jgi:hypothetical protein